MRANRSKDFNQAPNSLSNAKEKQEEIALSGDKSLIEEDIYKGEEVLIEDPNDPYYGEMEHEVRLALRRLYNNKCAYCECIEYKPDVEHYRPKGRVTGPQSNNHGYYWLCYEWSNLLPSCADCNRPPGKANKFPLLGTRVTIPPLIPNSNQLDFDKGKADNNYLQSEQPGLFHPDIDTPEPHFTLDWKGKLSSKAASPSRASYSIDTFDLNRGNLIIARKSIIDEFKVDIDSCFLLYRNSSQPNPADLKFALLDKLRKYKEKSDPRRPYSFVPYFIFENHPSFINDKFSELNSIEKNMLSICFNEINQSFP